MHRMLLEKFLPAAAIAAVAVVLIMRTTGPNAVAAPRDKASSSTSALQVTSSATGLTVFDADSGEVFLVRLPYDEKTPVTAIGTLRKKSPGKLEFAPLAPAGNNDAAAEAAKLVTAKVDIAALNAAIAMFQIDTTRFPSTEEGLQSLVVQPPGVDNWKGPYIKKLPKDPWGNPYIYRQPGKRNPTRFDLSSFGPNGVDGGGDDILEK